MLIKTHMSGTFNLTQLNTSNIDISSELSVGGDTTIGGHIIPSANDTFDIGSAERKIRDLYVSDNSIWIGDETKISFSDGKMKFRKRKKNVVPAAIIAAGSQAGHANSDATKNAALAYAGVGSITDMKIHHWHNYMRTLQAAALMTDIFRDNRDDYEETSASDAWKEINDTKIYTDANVGIGTSDPESTLHIRGSIKVEDGFSLARNEGSNPSVIIDTQNFGLDTSVVDLTGMGSDKYTKLYRVYGTNSQGVGKNWYWGYANDDYTNFSLSFDGSGGDDPDIAFVFTTASELYCNEVHSALKGNADTATRLQTARNINGVAFDGSADITVGVDGITSSNNNIGIGTENPNQILQVNGNAYFTNSGEAGNILHGDKKLALQSDSTVLIVCDTNDTTGDGSQGDIIFGSGTQYDTNANKDFTWSQVYPTGAMKPRNERMRIKGSGNVGIGTDSPKSALHVSGDSAKCVIADNTEDDCDVNGFNTGIVFADNTWNGSTLYADNPTAGMGFYLGHLSSGNKEVNMKNLTGELSFGTRNVHRAMYIDNDGKVGIGTDAPSNPFHVQSTTTGTHTMRITHTDTAATGSSHGLIIGANYSGADTFEGDKTHAGIYIDMDSSATGGGTSHEHRMYGVYSDVRHTGDSDIVYGGWFYARSDHASGTNTALRGINAMAQDSGLGTNSQVYGGEFKAIKDSGSTNTTPTMMGLRAEVEVDAGTVTTVYGVHSHIDRDGGTITNGYLFHGSYAGSDTGNKFGVHVNGEERNYFSNKVGIKTDNPNQDLDVRGSFRATGSISLDDHTTAYPTIHFTHHSDGNIEYIWNDDGNASGYTGHYHFVCDSALYATGNARLFAANYNTSSDDRLKENEVKINNGLDVIKRLNGQTYDKFHRIDARKNYARESGFIAQDIWYDIPELRHAVELNGSIPVESIPKRDENIQKDLDYSEYGWGPEPSSVDYVEIIPYAVDAIKQVDLEQNRITKKISSIPHSSALEHAHKIVCSVPTDSSYVTLSSMKNQKSVCGVISEHKARGIDSNILIDIKKEGFIWIVDKDGDFELGDLVTSSEVSGYGTKQSDDLLRNYTVAKIIQDCDFNPKDVPIKRKVQITKNEKYYTSDIKTRISKEWYDKLPESKRAIISSSKRYANVSDPEDILGAKAYNELDSSDKEKYEKIIEYYSVYERFTKIPITAEGSVEVMKQELVDELDENGQIKWIEDPSETTKAYKIRYLDSEGKETVEANCVYKAALVKCMFMCG